MFKNKNKKYLLREPNLTTFLYLLILEILKIQQI